MTNSKPEQKKPKTKYTVTLKGQERAKRALKRLGFGSEENLAKSILLSRSTVAQFFNGQPIQGNSFQRICEKLTLKWTEIAELPTQESLEGFSIQALEITRESGNELISTKSTKSNDKWVLVQDIVRQPLSGRDLHRAELSDVDLSDTNLRGADLRGANLKNADLSDANLRSAYLNGADLSNAELSNANLSNANLSNANLSNANLSDANLKNADLSNADLSDANLSNADLSNAYLRFVNLSNTNLSGVEVNNARFGFNQGISALIKLKLIKRGATF